MIDITEKGFATLKSLRKSPYNTLNTRERTDLAILSQVWDVSERTGRPLDAIDTQAVIVTLQRQDPFWRFVPNSDYVDSTVEKLVYTKHLERD